jgi:hypothetical protein
LDIGNGTGFTRTTLTAGSNVTITNASGAITIAASSGGSPGGSTTQVQYNNAGAFGGITGATTNGTALTLVAPVLGTPASGTVTNLTGTASININGTVGATTPASVAATTGTFSSTLAVTGVTTIAAGSEALPALTTTGNTNTGVWFPAANTVAVSTAGSERMRVSSSGNLGIGTTTPGGSTKLNVAGRGLFTGGISDPFDSTPPGVSISMSSTVGVIQAVETGIDVFKLALNPLGGNVGIGTSTPGYKLEVSTDSAGKPGVGGLWTVVSDERIKSDIVPANLDRCYEIVKSVPLKHFSFAPGVYTDDQIQDKHNLGWIAQDVQKVFKNAVSVKPFTLKTDIPDGTEKYEEQDFTLESVEKTETSIQVINGKPVQVSKVVTSENKVMLFDTVDVLDEAGIAVMEDYEVTPAVQAVEATDEAEAIEAIPAVMGTRPVTYQMPRMITKTRPKVRHDVIEDCLDLNGGQMIAALYGAVQGLMEKVETLTTRITVLEAKE